MSEPVAIGGRAIGDNLPVFIVAEAGSNHDRDYGQALALIDVAAEAGADAVKFQSFEAARLYPRSAGQCSYLDSPESIYDIVDRIAMPAAWIPGLAAHCERRGVAFMSTVFDERAAAVVDPHVQVHKIASYELTHTPLVRAVARLGKPVIVSTGAASLDEVREVVRTIEEEGNRRIVICQCTAKYPAPLEALNLKAIPALREATGCLVGLSDHSREPILAPVAAVALGACLIEKHFTLRNDLPGPDHRFAVEPAELRRMVDAVRDAERAVGDGIKRVHDVEHELRTFARRSIFTTRAVRRGERLGESSIAVLRCGDRGFGLPPSAYELVIGRVAVRDLPADVPVTDSDLE